MLNQPPKAISTLALLEPEITGRTHPILPSDEWGINLAAARGVYPDHGLQVYINPWNNMKVGDKVTLFRGADEVDSHFISDQADVGERVTLFVAPRNLSQGSHVLIYRISNPVQTPEDSPPVKIYVKLDIPAGQDTQEGPGHSNLHMFLPPEIVTGGVDKETAEAGVPIIVRAASGTGKPYPDIAVGDCMQISWGGVFVWSDPVTLEQISAPQDNPIEILVTKATIETAGDSDSLPVTFRVRDIVHNYSEDWCNETRLSVSMGTSLLIAPIVKGATNNVIDLDATGNPNVWGQVVTTSLLFKIGDVIELKVRGTTSSGETVELTPPPQEIDNLPHVYEFEIENSDLRRLVDTQVIFSYQVTRTGEPSPLLSKGQFVQVSGQSTQLAAPIAEDDNQGALDPDLPHTRILIPFNLAIKHGSAIEVVWFGVRPDNSVYNPPLEWYLPDEEEAEDPNGFFITVDGRHVKTLEGGTLTLSYLFWFEDEQGEPQSRPSLSAAPLNVGEPQFELDKPIVQGENNGSLEPNDLPNGVGQLTIPRPLANPWKTRDVVTYKWTAEGAGDHEDSVNITSLNQGQDLKIRLNETFVKDHIEANRGSKITVNYRLFRTADNKYSYSNPLAFTVGQGQEQLLDPAKVVEAVDDILDPANAPNGATVEIPANSPDNAGDHFYMTWKSADGTVEEKADKPITGNNKGKPVVFPISREVVLASLGKTVTVNYRVVQLADDKEVPGKPYQLTVQEQEFKLPVARFKEASGQQNDLLNPDDVYPAGATVVIQAAARLKTDDEIIVTVEGITTTTYPHTVLSTEADKELSVIKVPHAFVNANLEGNLALSYTVKRNAGGTDGPSDPTIYDVRKVIGSGSLKIMGARYNRSTYRASSASRVLSAFNAVTGAAVQAQWKYPSDSEWKTAATWRDTSPQEPLQVRTADDQVTLNPANIIGNGIDTTATGQAAFVAHRDEGDVVGWGDAAFGASIPSSIIVLDEIVEVSCSRSAYVVRVAKSGAIAAWGNAAEGGNIDGVPQFGFVEVIGNSTALAGLKNTGQVFAWGNLTDGGLVPENIARLTDVVRIVAAGQAFAAIQAAGNVVAWGNAANGGTVPGNIGGLTGIDNLIGSYGAFAAHLRTNRIVGWGHATYGGAVPEEIALLDDIIELSCANAQAFTARRATGQVVAWGTPEYGGTIGGTIGGMTNIVEVSSTWRAFAARLSNGSVVAWGRPAEGGTVPEDIARMNDIVQVCGSSMAFAALRKDGTVVAWGNADVGGAISKEVADQLTQVQALYDNTHGFTALTADGRVVTWGHPGGGGDSSAVQRLLLGQVSYKASPASRGLSLKAARSFDSMRRAKR
ncbi:RCC1 domain-containing protein [Pseudomonas sp. WC2]|uniref:RCC1 domain-containing protein n=1 Tax=Pseudomonas sp. WC2 TaxID=3424773 RepID=UPI003D335AD3